MKSRLMMHKNYLMESAKALGLMDTEYGIQYSNSGDRTSNQIVIKDKMLNIISSL